MIPGGNTGWQVEPSDEAELDARRETWRPPESRYDRGYYRLYIDHVLQADRGCDFDFLVGSSTSKVTRDSH